MTLTDQDRRDRIDATAGILTDLGLPSLAARLRDVIDELLPEPTPAHRGVAGGDAAVNLAGHLTRHALRGGDDAYRVECGCGWIPDMEALDYHGRVDIQIDAAHAEHVAESWAEHRTITTVADGLDLPDGTVLRDAEGEVHLLHVPSPTPISLPARILYHPEEDQ